MLTLFKQYIFPRLVIDIFVFYAILMILAFFVARIELNAEFLIGALVNYLMLVFAFVINDIEDREDDAKTTYQPQTWGDNFRMMFGLPTKVSATPGAKRFSNPFSTGVLSVSQGYVILVVLAVVSLGVSYAIGTWLVVLVAVSNLVVGILYSLKSIRLKSVPGFDMLSHAYLLSAVQILYFLAYPGAVRDFWSLLVVGLVFLHSLSGDLHNEYRDFEDDQGAGIRNTATLLGKRNTRLGALLMNAISFLIVLSLVIYLAASYWAG